MNPFPSSFLVFQKNIELHAVIDAWLASSLTYTTFFTSSGKPTMVQSLLKVALVPPFRVFDSDELIGVSPFAFLVQIGLFTSSPIPQLTGVQLRAFASDINANDMASPVLRQVAVTLQRIFFHVPETNSFNFEHFVADREVLVRVLNPEQSLFRHRYSSPLGKWYQSEELKSLVFAAFPPDTLPEFKVGASLLEDLASFQAPLVCRFRDRHPRHPHIDVLTLDTLADGRELFLLMQVKFTAVDDGDKELERLPKMVNGLSRAVEIVQKERPRAGFICFEPLLCGSICAPSGGGDVDDKSFALPCQSHRDCNGVEEEIGQFSVGRV